MLTEQKPFYLKLSNGLFIIVILFIVLYVAKNIFMPLAFGALFAILLITPCTYLERLGLSRGLSALLSILIALLFFLFVSYFISSRIVAFKKDVPALVSQLTTAIIDLQGWLETKFHISTERMKQMVHTITLETLSFSFFSSTFSTLSTTLLYFLIINLYTFLLLLYRHLVVQFLVASFKQHSDKVYEFLLKTRYVIKSYLLGLIIEMLIVASINCLGFFIIGVKYAFLLGVIAALLNLVPYLGIFTALIISVLITSTTNSVSTVIGLAIVLFVVHLVDSNFLFPRIVGSKVKINVLASILGVFIGETLWGIPGMFLAIPIIAILKVMFEQVEGLHPWVILIGDDVRADPKEQVLLTKLARPFIKRKDRNTPRIPE